MIGVEGGGAKLLDDERVRLEGDVALGRRVVEELNFLF